MVCGDLGRSELSKSKDHEFLDHYLLSFYRFGSSGSGCLKAKLEQRQQILLIKRIV